MRALARTDLVVISPEMALSNTIFYWPSPRAARGIDIRSERIWRDVLDRPLTPVLSKHGATAISSRPSATCGAPPPFGVMESSQINFTCLWRF